MKIFVAFLLLSSLLLPVFIFTTIRAIRIIKKISDDNKILIDENKLLKQEQIQMLLDMSKGGE